MVLAFWQPQQREVLLPFTWRYLEEVPSSPAADAQGGRPDPRHVPRRGRPGVPRRGPRHGARGRHEPDGPLQPAGGQRHPGPPAASARRAGLTPGPTPPRTSPRGGGASGKPGSLSLARMQALSKNDVCVAPGPPPSVSSRALSSVAARATAPEYGVDGSPTEPTTSTGSEPWARKSHASRSAGSSRATSCTWRRWRRHSWAARRPAPAPAAAPWHRCDGRSGRSPQGPGCRPRRCTR